MRYFLSKHFKKQLKKYLKKFPKLRGDFLKCLTNLNLENELHVGKGIYKVRVGSSDLKKGKSGSFRSYIYFYKRNRVLLPLCVYLKSDHESISDTELKFHFDRVIFESLDYL